jgi:multidrug efflux pump subunit AcrA (membrane-fusion protein)
MTVDVPHSDREMADASWRQIEQLIDDIALLAKTDISQQEFHAALLDHSIAALAAPGGAIWTADDMRPTLEYQVNLAQTQLAAEDADNSGHERLLRSVLASGVPRVVAPQSGSTDEADPANPTEFLLVLCPLHDDNKSIGVVELLQRPNTAPAVKEGALRLLASFCELASEFYSRRQLRQLRTRESLRDRLEAFSTAVHQSLDFDKTTYTIANDGRDLLNSDRLSVVARRRSTFQLAAISGAHRLERRSNAVRRLESLAASVLATGQSLYYTDGETNDLPPEIKQPLNAYLDESHARVLIICPLHAESAIDPAAGTLTIGALVVEEFDAAATDDLPSRVESLARHCEPALRNALEFRKWPIPRIVRNSAWFVRAEQLPRTALVLGAVLAAVLSLVLIPADFKIEARGTLQPLHRRDVFAPRNASVAQLLTTEEKAVKANEPLLVLRDPQLELEFERVWGDMQTARKRLAAVQAKRVAAEFGDARSRAESKQLSAEEAEIKEMLKSLNAQYEILEEQRAELTVRSPIAGRVLTWNIKQLLESRPVQTGQILMTVADTSGPWELQLHVPDDDVGHVIDAQRANGGPLKLTFILATNPNITHEESVETIAMSTELDDEKQPSVLVTAGIKQSQLLQMRPGATVIARIHCGRRSLGYVWLRELIEAVQTHVLFW